MSTTSTLLPIGILLLVSLLLRALFAFLETSLTALRLFRLKELAKQYPRYEKLFTLLEQQPERVLVTILIASNIADVIAAATAPELTQRLFEQLGFSSTLGFFLGIILATLLILIFGEIIPKSLARGIANQSLIATLPIANAVYGFFSPISKILIALSHRIGIWFGTQENGKPGWISSWKELRFLISYTHEKGLLEPENAVMLHSIFEASRTPIDEIMTPAEKIVSLSDTTTITEALQAFIQHSYTRLPIYHNTPQHIVGLLHLKDIVRLSDATNQTITPLLRPVMFVSPSMLAKQLLHQFLERNVHLAIVIDSQSNAIGLVTLEDTLEEIVGEISDEHN